MDPELVPWTPLIATVADVPMADTPETEQLEEQFRIARLGAVLREVLTGVLDTPTLLVIEDAQWIDDASTELLDVLTADLAGRPWLVLVTRRGETADPVGEQADGVRLVLEPLGHDDVVAVLRDATLDAPISDHDIRLLAERSTGNPLFLAELVAGARAVGDVSALPDSVEALVAASIDRLPPQDRDLLRRIAVLGRTFPEELVPAVLDAAAPRRRRRLVARRGVPRARARPTHVPTRRRPRLRVRGPAVPSSSRDPLARRRRDPCVRGTRR